MRATLNIDDELLLEAQKITHIKEKTAVVHAGLKALIEREATRRLNDPGRQLGLDRQLGLLHLKAAERAKKSPIQPSK